MLSLRVDEPLPFRFSALTYNTHRIHDDLGYVPIEGLTVSSSTGPCSR